MKNPLTVLSICSLFLISMFGSYHIDKRINEINLKIANVEEKQQRQKFGRQSEVRGEITKVDERYLIQIIRNEDNVPIVVIIADVEEGFVYNFQKLK